MFGVITENDQSQWSDATGSLYHFPKRYSKYLRPGTDVIYYKGGLTNKKFASNRLSNHPHYFGVAKIGEVFPDQESSKGDLFAIIENYQPFDEAVFAKQNGQYLEIIPESRRSNYWRDGVRQISEDTYRKIISQANFDKSSLPDEIHAALEVNDLEQVLESGVEGDKTHRYVSTYERDSALRKAAIAFHKPVCKGCGFDFEVVYGEHGKGYIQIHHIQPIASFDSPKMVNPQTDLVPLCANCHAMVHRRKDRTLSVDDLKKMIAGPAK